MEGGGERKRKPSLGPDGDDPLPTGNNDAEKEPQPVAEESAESLKPSAAVDGGGEEKSPLDPHFLLWSDQDLREAIARMKCTLKTMGKNLPDGGKKLRVNIMRHEAELHSRKNRRDDDRCRKLVQPINDGTCTGGPDFTRPRAPSSVPSLLSINSSRFCSKLDDNTGHWTTNAPGKDISTLYHCGSKNTRVVGKFSAPGIQKGGLSLRQTLFQSPNHLSVNVVEQSLSNGEQKRNLSSTPSPRHFEEDLSGQFTKIAARVQPSQNTRHGNTIVLGDEEEREVPKKTRQEDQVYECMKETKIYYPSRDDPESVEICYSDLECLAPDSYLSSAIMNFYIRYLQKRASSTDTERHDYHFFNTYFYNKMKHDVLRKNERETSFVKFRRWWKGVNIFEKAYIFLPIHENLHWSLVIFCIPDKEDESGPILLHLDSLKLHSSKQIFGNIRSFLIEEWKVLRQGESKSQFLIADKIWQKLSRRIDEKIIEVPQQKNDYDCGLFVLYFMERFLEDAPERLKKKDLAMFGRRWFKPEEASSLRRKIRNLLKEKFKNANEGKSVLNP